MIANRVDTELDVFSLVNFEFGDAVGDFFAVDGGGEGFILEFLVDAFGFEITDAVGSDFGAGHDKAGEFIDSEEDLCKE